MFQRILVPLDGSPGAERALPVAARIARNAGGSLVFLHVVSPAVVLEKMPSPVHQTVSTIEKEERVLSDAANYLAAVITTYAEELIGVPTEMDVAFGLTSPTLASAARLEQVDLVVMCSHRETNLGQWGIEGIAQQTLRRSPVPCLILNEHGQIPLPDANHPLRAIVPLDGSLFAELALEPALQILSQLACSSQDELRLVRIVTERQSDKTNLLKQGRQEAEQYLNAACTRLRKREGIRQDLHITSLVQTNENVASAILGQTRESGYTHLVVMATHGREGMQRLMLGSIAECLLSTATCPLLIVCPRSIMTRKTKPGQFSIGNL